MKQWKMQLMALLCLVLSGCASKPIVDTYNVDMVQYQKDLDQCLDVAGQVESGKKVASSAAAGALVGAAVGSVGYYHNDIVDYAAAGAVTGGVAGGVSSENEKEKVAKNCMRNRGYVVLN